MADARLTATGEDFERTSTLEWLTTNHTGAFAMGTVAGVNTRRYHGLLIASLNPPVDRYSIVPRVEEQVSIGSDRFELATVQYPGTVQPRGFELLESFRREPLPQWVYRCGGAAITKTVCLLDNQQSVLVRYEATETCRLAVRMFVSFRDYHSLTKRNDALRRDFEEETGTLRFSPYPDLPTLTVHHAGAFQSDGVWYENHEYLRELDRGLDFQEDLFSPGVLMFELSAGASCYALFTLQPEKLPSRLDQAVIDGLLAAESKRQDFGTGEGGSWASALDQFRVTRADGQRSLIAGYPWFTDWSRDTLISLPALSLARFPLDETRSILETLIGQRRQGLVPNRFADRHSIPEYNTVDASLWLFVAAHDFIKQSNDKEFLSRALYPALADTIAWHRRGTHYDIHVDPEDHLLWAGNPGTQLTWMDAVSGGVPVTPRFGKAVEINALWYNALLILATWAEELGHTINHAELKAEAAAVYDSFNRAFWNAASGCLYDVVRPSYQDTSIRPNQLFAASLPFPLLSKDNARTMVEVVKSELLTPVGVRTLAPSDPVYKPRFKGPMTQRDAAYHQGTVWPWLIGPFVAAYLYAYDDSPDALRFCRILLGQLGLEWTARCLGSLTEVYDGEPPRQAEGCPAQLWSVAQFVIGRNRVLVSR